MEFKEYKLEDISKEIKYGKMPKKSKILSSGKYPIFTGYKLVGFYEEFNIDEPKLIVVARGVGGTGDVKISPPNCYLTNLSIYIDLKENIVNKYYLYYLYMLNNLRYLDSGSAQSQITITDLKSVVVSVPSLLNQNKIVKILSKLDEKIEVNNQINNNLQKLSQELYKRWFVDFEFPNGEGKPYKSSGGEMIESELGEIPKGWKISNFDDDILTKIIKSGVDSYPGEKRYVATADVNGTKINNFSKLKYNEKPSRANMPPIKNSVWFAKMKGSVKNILVEEFMEEIIDNYIFSTGFLGMECLNKSTSYIWSIINDDKFISDKDNLSTGTLMAGINNETIKKYKYLIPVVRVLEKYNETIENINREIYSLNSENSQLTNLRDTLLPKLLNGEIDLEQIEV